METERTKDRRVLREKRLAYFEKVALAPKPQPHPPKESRPISRSSLTESKESRRSLTNKKGNKSARKSVNKGTDLSKVTTNGHVAPLTVSSSPRRVLGTTSGGNVTPKRGGQQISYNKNNNLEPGARPKIRNQQYVNGGLWSKSTHVDRREKSDVYKNEVLRNTFDLNEEVSRGQRSIGDGDEHSDRYESLAWNTLETGRDGNYDSSLAPVSVPMVIPAEHGLFKMGTKEQPQEQTREDDLHEVFRLERRYDYPRGRDLGRHSYEDAQKAAMEHNAFGVDSMLNEMRQVRRVKSQLHEELRESFDTFGSVSEILGKGSRENGEERDVRVQMLDDGTEKGSYQNNLGGNFTQKEIDAEMSAIGKYEDVEINHSRQNQNGHWQLERQNGSIDYQNEHVGKGRSINDSIFGNSDKGSIDVGRNGDMNVSFESQTGQTEGRRSEDENRIMGDEQGQGNHGDKKNIVGGNHGDKNSQEVKEEDEFNLGALCAAAKQGDDILKDYIKRLTQKILNKDSDADTKEGHVGVSKVTRDLQSNGQGLGQELTHVKGHKQPEEFTNSHHDDDRFFQASRLVNGYDHLQRHENPARKVQTAVYSSDKLKQLGYFNENIDHDDTKVEDIISNDSESSGHENYRHGSMPIQSLGDSQWEGEVGFETHRPSDRAYSPIKVVRFAGSEENNERLAKSEEGRDEYLQSDFSEGYHSPAGEKELDGIGEIEELNEEGEEGNQGGYPQEPQSLSFKGTGEEEYKEEIFQGEVSSHFLVNDFDSGNAGSTFNFFRDVKPSNMDDLEFPQPLSQGFHQGDLDSSQELQTEPIEEARRKVRSARRPRTPEEHKRGVERHHQRERQKERLEEVLSDAEEDEGKIQDDIQVDDLRLSLGSVNTSTEIDQNTFFTEIPSGNMQNGSKMHSHEQFAYSFETEERLQRKHDDEDDESVLMQKISQFHPSIGVGEGENIYGGSEDLVNGYHDNEKDPLSSELFHHRRDDKIFQPQASFSPSADFANLNVNPSMSNSHEFSLNSGEERNDSINTKKEVREPVKTKSGGVRPKSASQLRASGSSQYKSRWPQSSSLMPSRPKKVNQRFSSPERKLGKKSRPASAKVNGESSDTGSKGQRSRPRSAIQQSVSMEPGASGDFFNVKSSKMFDGGITRASSTGPLTLKLILDSPRERQHHSIWQLLPDEILLRIFSHLKPPDLVNCARVCQGFYRVALDDSLWRLVHLEKKRLSDYQLTQIGGKHPTSVVFLQCEGKNVTENGLRNLFRTCVDSLQELNVSGCSGEMFSGDSVLLHASRCYNLSNIDASWCNVTDNGLNAVSGGCNRLSSVCLNGCQSVSDVGLRSLIEKHGPNLIVLEVFGCIDLSPLTLQRIGDICKNLHSLNIGQCYKVTDESVYEVMPKLKTLRHLDVRGCKQIRDDCVRRIARSCKRLETLVLANCTFVSNASMVEIAANLKSIRSLDMSGCKRITSEGVRSVAMCCTKLRALNLSSTSIDRKSISTLASYCSISLRELKLNCCKDITEASIIKLLKHCKGMETVHLYGVKGLRNLGLLKLQYPCLMYE